MICDFELRALINFKEVNSVEEFIKLKSEGAIILKSEGDIIYAAVRVSENKGESGTGQTPNQPAGGATVSGEGGAPKYWGNLFKAWENITGEKTTETSGVSKDTIKDDKGVQ